MWIVWFCLSFFDGLRYILIHQFIDRENDRATGTHTFVSDRQMNIRKWILYLCMAEGVCCIFLLVPLFARYSVIIISGLAFNFILEFCIYEVLNVYAKKDWLVSYDSVPLEALLNIIMPVMFGLCMAKRNVWAGLFCIFILVCCFKSLKIKLGIANVFLKSKFS